MTSLILRDSIQKRFKQYDAELKYDFVSPRQMMQRALAMTDLYVVASEQVGDPKKDLLPYKEVCFSHENPDFANLSIAEGIAASAGFPFVFRTQKIKDAQGKTHLFRDGGLTNNYPLEVFDGPNGEPNPNTLCLGIVVKKNAPAQGAEQAPPEDGKKMRQFKKIAKVLGWPVEHTIEVFNRHKADELSDKRDTNRMVLTEVEGDVVDFNLSPEKRRGYFGQGYTRMEEHIAQTWPPTPVVVDITVASPLLNVPLTKAISQKTR